MASFSGTDAPNYMSIGSGSGAGDGLAPEDKDQHVYMDIDSADELSTGIYISNDTVGWVGVSINGVWESVGDGVKTTACYFSADGGATARAMAAIETGDELFWNALVAGYGLVTTDDVSLCYTTKP